MRPSASSVRLRKMIVSALFIAVAYLFRFIFHFNAAFLTFEFKDAVICIGGLYLGPLYALVMSAIVALLEFATISGTGWYGLLMNFLAAAAFSVVASLLYRFRRTMGGAIVALFLGVCALAGVMIPANLLITPRFMGVETAAVVSLIPKLLLPFNLVKGLMNAGVVLLLYKPVTTALYHAHLLDRGTFAGTYGKPAPVTESSEEQSEVIAAPALSRPVAAPLRFRWIVPVAAVILIAVSLMVFFLFLHGDFTVLEK